MSIKEKCPNITIQSSIQKIDKKLATLLTSSYLFFCYTNDVMLRTTTADGMNDLTQMEAEFF